MLSINAFYLYLGVLMVLGIIMTKMAKRRPTLRRPVMIVYLFLAALYFIVRALWTIPQESLLGTSLGWLLLAAEFIGALQTASFVLLFWTQAKQNIAPAIDLDRAPTVDVLIATYNEPVDIVERTVVAALQLNYPQDRFTVYLCDDGRREQMKELAAKWGIGYLDRPDNTGAKAGNLNNALERTRGEFIVTMDADMLLKPRFLQETLGHFMDEAVGFVQTPQAFHNADIFQHNLYSEAVVRNDQDFFMRSLQPQRGRFNAAIYVGSGAVFRRTALKQINGFVPDVITEDMATGMVLNNAGWRGEYVNKVLATGLAAETYAELLKQRSRWGRGNIQILKKYGLQGLKNLSFVQRWLFLDGVAYWFFGVFRLLFLIFPLVAVFSGVRIVQVEGMWMIALWAAQFFFAHLVYETASQGRFKKSWSALYEYAQAPQIASAVLGELFFSRKVDFKVTAKGIELEQASFDWRNAWPQLVLALGSLVALGAAIVKVFSEGSSFLLLNAIPLAWLIYNTINLCVAVVVAIDRPRFRHQLQKHYALASLGSDAELLMDTEVVGIHVQKACVSVPANSTQLVPSDAILMLHLEGLDPLPAQLEEVRKVGERSYAFLRFEDLKPAVYAQLSFLLDALNTEKFKIRPNTNRVGFYDITIGALKRRSNYIDPLLGAGTQYSVLSEGESRESWTVTASVSAVGS